MGEELKGDEEVGREDGEVARVEVVADVDQDRRNGRDEDSSRGEGEEDFTGGKGWRIHRVCQICHSSHLPWLELQWRQKAHLFRAERVTIPDLLD